MPQVQEFLQTVAEDRLLQEQLSNAPTREAAIQFLVELGQKSGCNFTSEEMNAAVATLEAALANDGEMCDEELEAVAGGFIGGFANDIWQRTKTIFATSAFNPKQPYSPFNKNTLPF